MLFGCFCTTRCGTTTETRQSQQPNSDDKTPRGVTLTRVFLATFTFSLTHGGLLQLYLWGLPFFFFFCVPSYISGVRHSSSSAFPSYISEVHHSSSSSSSAFPAISLGFTILLHLPSPAISLRFTILLLLRSQLYLWGSPFFFICLPQLYL